jgi:hypothetical protein
MGEQSRGLGDGRCGSSHVRSAKFKDCLYRLSDIQWAALSLRTISPASWQLRIPITPGVYAAQYLEAVFTPGMTAPLTLIQVLKPGTQLAARHVSKRLTVFKSAGPVAPGHRAGWATYAPNRNRHRGTPRSGSDPARRQ